MAVYGPYAAGANHTTEQFLDAMADCAHTSDPAYSPSKLYDLDWSPNPTNCPYDLDWSSNPTNCYSKLYDLDWSSDPAYSPRKFYDLDWSSDPAYSPRKLYDLDWSSDSTNSPSELYCTLDRSLNSLETHCSAHHHASEHERAFQVHRFPCCQNHDRWEASQDDDVHWAAAGAAGLAAAAGVSSAFAGVIVGGGVLVYRRMMTVDTIDVEGMYEVDEEEAMDLGEFAMEEEVEDEYY
ncbi:MAG: hypothetical protein KVP17_000576 [Porospora cf. gigantea B]|uniref:uncharacterized protein n=1 Tax=Porospora cf. gigantea B TaxID=2853592 RepID=UPI003571EF30|nr:MAG: hypothetical protein KVP17_000576 [Porospora cf. gigantea B]